MVRANFLARASAACLLACPLLILPPLPDVSSPSRVSILTTVVYCHLPPRAVGILLRFNSSASAWREMKPAALSPRRVEAKARARESAARLFANAPGMLRRREEVPRTRSIGPSWLVLDVRLGGKNVTTADLLGQHYCKASVALNRISDCNLGPSIHRKPAVAIHTGTCDKRYGPGLKPVRPFRLFYPN
jgi:hypothetical protein